jgi:CheY-like chemotaxis protein
MAKVLYVDADVERSEAVCTLFAQRGHTVTAATSAERAMLHADREADYDAVVAHLILPSIDGAELCRWLQRWSALSRVPRVVFTSPGVRLRLNLQDGLPRWLPADVYIHGLEDLQSLVEAVEWALQRG